MSKITGWTNYDDQNYKKISGTYYKVDDEKIKLRKLVVDELKKHGYKFCGFYHQRGRYGVPILDNKYILTYTYRSWGDIMAEVLNLNDPKDNMAYCNWAWAPPEEQILPKPSDYEEGAA